MEKEKEFKAFEKAVIKYPYADTEELNDEHHFIFEWFWKRYADIREDAWKYKDLCKMISSHTTSRELSERLKKLGVPQISHFIFQITKDNPGGYITDQQGPYKYETERYSAYLASELAEILPREFDYKTSSKEKSGYDGFRSLVLTIGKTVIDNGWYVMYSDLHPANKVPIHTKHADTLPEAMGKMLEYLAKEGLIKFN